MNAEPVACYVGLGSNLQHPRFQVEAALKKLAALPETVLTARSNWYRTQPVGPQDQPDFINGVARLETRLRPEPLLRQLQQIERAQGRRPSAVRWGPRVLDLDLLLYGTLHQDRPKLRIPHPELGRRAFVLIPLAEIAPPDLCIPGQGRLDQCLAACSHAGVWPLDAEISA